MQLFRLLQGLERLGREAAGAIDVGGAANDGGGEAANVATRPAGLARSSGEAAGA